MIIGVPRETYPGERRVALVPMVLPTLSKAGFEVVVEAGAGEQAGYPDRFYAEKGARILAERVAVFSAADIVVRQIDEVRQRLFRKYGELSDSADSIREDR